MQFRFLLLFPFFLLAISCNNQQPVAENADTMLTPTDSSQVTKADNNEIPDSVFTVFSEGKEYLILCSHLPNDSDGYISKTRVKILQGESVLSDQVFDFNTVGRLQEPKKGTCFLDLYNSGGGSGFSGTVFRVRLGGKTGLDTAFNFNELTSWKFNRNANLILCASGYWDMSSQDDENFEAHFDAHRQSLFFCREKNGVFTEELIGTTKGKYNLTEETDAWEKLKEGEPGLAKKIDWEMFE